MIFLNPLKMFYDTQWKGLRQGEIKVRDISNLDWFDGFWRIIIPHGVKFWATLTIVLFPSCNHQSREVAVTTPTSFSRAFPRLGFLPRNKIHRHEGMCHLWIMRMLDDLAIDRRESQSSEFSSDEVLIVTVILMWNRTFDESRLRKTCERDREMKVVWLR